jgi:hypothetical protein
LSKEKVELPVARPAEPVAVARNETH